MELAQHNQAISAEKTNLSVYTQKQLDLIAKELNERPRKTLNFLSPMEKILAVL
ncbi:hypothetical protein SAMN06296273_1867 [Nitrosomonas ureae]|uniref:Integrase catalytic domain-containing protein n=1 Tax=Nitrosomonas ureae TaxID=44577 RepID=A0A285BYW1_9PROT|nr:hypothetical protein SAMN06296273_1867 [Nitrosomonas ureae]